MNINYLKKDKLKQTILNKNGKLFSYLRFLFWRYVDLKNFYKYHLIPEKRYISNKFKKSFGYPLNLKQPKTLNEKIQWLKLNDRTKLHTSYADKYEARKFIKEKIGEEYLVPLIFETKDIKQLIPSNLPDFPVIIKTNHDSSGGLIIKEKEKNNWKEIQKRFKKQLKKNYYYQSKEWQYKNIKPRVIVEKLLIDDEGNMPFDYKVHCFNGRTTTIQVDIDRFGFHQRNWYSIAWQREPFYWSALKGGRKTDPADWDIKKPICLDKMLELSELLAKDFIYVRVDWYIFKRKLYFGELTFHHDSGYQPILPKNWDLKLGQMLKLPVDA